MPFLLGEVSFLAKDPIFFLNYDIVDLAKRFSNRSTFGEILVTKGTSCSMVWGF
jgi:hypothetical protein